MGSSQSTPFKFSGLSGLECEAFVQAVQQHAFAAGKARDMGYMADCAAACMEGAALRWFDELDSDIQTDWNLLRKALLAKYPKDCVAESHSSPAASIPSAFVPTPAAAPPMVAVGAASQHAIPAGPLGALHDLPMRDTRQIGATGPLPSPAIEARRSGAENAEDEDGTREAWKQLLPYLDVQFDSISPSVHRILSAIQDTAPTSDLDDDLTEIITTGTNVVAMCEGSFPSGHIGAGEEILRQLGESCAKLSEFQERRDATTRFSPAIGSSCVSVKRAITSLRDL